MASVCAYCAKADVEQTTNEAVDIASKNRVRNAKKSMVHLLFAETFSESRMRSFRTMGLPSVSGEAAWS